jgi:SHS2 domain-containing protein
MTAERGFKYHDHTADITVECWAPTLEEAFEEAALGALEVILDTSTVQPVESIDVTVHGVDLEELLVEWIGHLIALIDINSQFYSKFQVQKISRDAEGFALNGRIWGEDINLERHDARTEAKAMTYADMSIEQGSKRTTLRFTLDL